MASILGVQDPGLGVNGPMANILGVQDTVYSQCKQALGQHDTVLPV